MLKDLVQVEKRYNKKRRVAPKTLASKTSLLKQHYLYGIGREINKLDKRSSIRQACLKKKKKKLCTKRYNFFRAEKFVSF